MLKYGFVIAIVHRIVYPVVYDYILFNYRWIHILRFIYRSRFHQTQTGICCISHGIFSFRHTQFGFRRIRGISIGRDALGGGFIMLFALFASFVVWVVLVPLIIKFPPQQVFCYGVAIIMAACFVFNCFLMGFNRSILLLLLVNSACFISCAFLIAKAKSLPMKIIALTSTLALFILPWMMNV